MKLEGISTDSIQKTGPNPQDIVLIRAMHADGKSLKDIQRALPDIVPDALARWFDSLEAEVEAATKPAKPAAEKKPAKPADPLT